MVRFGWSLVVVVVRSWLRPFLLGIGFAGVALAFGLTVLTAAYALGHISGGHFNPAVSIGLWAGGRFEAKELAPYIISQLLGATLAAFILFIIVQGQAGFTGVGGFATNGYGELSPGKYSMLSALVIEIVLTAGFLIVIMGATDKRAPCWICPNCDRSCAYIDPSHQHSRHQYFGQPSA